MTTTTKRETKLTPTPWNVDGGYGTCVERDAEGERIHIADCIDSEHARHINRCVNAHDGLVAALRQTTNALQAACMVIEDDIARGIALRMVKDARAALAKVAP